MTAYSLGRIAIVATVALFTFAVFSYTVYRPWQLSWGETTDEVTRPMVGDELVKDPTFNATRAVTVNALAELVWPWIVQMGYNKAGFYSRDILDNNGIPSAERIIAEYQDLKVGDFVPPSKNTDAEVNHLEPNRRLLLVFQSEGSLTWA